VSDYLKVLIPTMLGCSPFLSRQRFLLKGFELRLKQMETSVLTSKSSSG